MTSPLIVDTYAGDLDGKTDIAKLIAAGPPWHGWLGKATQGNYYSAAAWFNPRWRAARETERYGIDWFRAAYHYFDVRVDPLKQADHYLRAVEDAGGFGPGDLWPVVDVERAGQRGPIDAERVITSVTQWTDKVKQETGRKVILYGGSFLRELGIRDHMGCDLLWVARYTETLPVNAYYTIGWHLDELFAWQYCGDGVGKLARYPTVSPIGKVDISVMTITNGGLDALRYIRNHMCSG